MTKEVEKLLDDLECGRISRQDVLAAFPIDNSINKEYVEKEVQAAIASEDTQLIQMSIQLIWLLDEYKELVGLLNELLVNPNHTSHQEIALALQVIRSPTTIPFVRKVLKSNFRYLAYTCSESGAIAKWFSWLLYAIGTDNAISLIEEYALSSDEGIKNEMLYRLKKLQ